MAASKGNVFDQYRCADVYDALDSAQFSQAISKADELLRQGPFPLAAALKLVALFRLGRKDEVVKEAEKLLAGKVDINVLLPLQMVLPHVGMAQQLADLYLAASKAHPNDPELFDGAILVLVKAQQFQRALQLLLKRSRETKEISYFWQYVQLAILHVR